MLALLAACAPQAPLAPVGTTLPGSSGGPTRPSAEEHVDVQKVLAAVVHVRGLTPTRPIPLRRVSDEEFDRVFEEGVARRRAKYGVAPSAPRDPQEDARYFVGFYDPTTRGIFVRRDRPPWLRDQSLSGTLAHELTHALQDQHFGLERLYDGLSPDAVHAMRAVLEGDAEITRVAAEAYLEGRPVKRSVVEASTTDETVPDEVRHPEYLADPALRAQPATTREAVMFPYVWGTLFVGAIYRAGGFPLVDKLYAVRPAATAYIYHPEDFVAGRPVEPVRGVTPPAGFRADLHDSVGEYGLRQLLWKLGESADHVARIGAAWRGDTLLSASDGKGHEFDSWTLAFSGEREAAEVQRLLATDGRTERSGTVVAFLSGEDARAARVDPAALVGPAPRPKPPLGDVTIPPAPAPIEARAEYRGVIVEDSFVDPFVGLHFKAPAGYELDANGPRGLLLLMTNHVSSDVTVLSSVRPTPDVIRVMKQALLQGTAKLGKPDRIVDGGMATPFGPASYRYVEFAGSPMTAQMRLMVVCGGEALLAEMRLLRRDDAASAHALDGWFWSLNARAVEGSPYCAAVRRQATTDLP